jgi:hypothetical protein
MGIPLGHNRYHIVVTEKTEVCTGISKAKFIIRCVGIMADTAVAVFDRLMNGFPCRIGRRVMAKTAQFTV